MLKEDKTKKREERHAITQEDFTPDSVVAFMLAKLPDDTFSNFNRKIMDNSCGIGNFLVEILRRRLDHCVTEEDSLSAVDTIFGVELMADNVEDCRNRLYNTIVDKFPNIAKNYLLNYKIKATIRNRIQWHDSLTFDYNHWPMLHRTPSEKHENVGFAERRKADDYQYPMWGKKKMQIIQPSLFDDIQ